MSQILDKGKQELQEEQRLLTERQKIDKYLREQKGNRERLRDLLNRDRIQLWLRVVENVLKEEEGVETVQWEEIIELKGFRIDRTSEPLGEGNFAQIYKAHWSDGGRDVACKVIRIKQLCQFFEIKDMDAHMKLLLHLNHPKLIKCLKGFLVANTSKLYLFMQLAPFGTIHDLVESQKKPVPLKTARNWMRDVFEALSFLHALGIAHRKVRPHNILLDKSKVVAKLTIPEAFAKICEVGSGKAQYFRCKVPGEIGRYTAPEALYGAPFDAIPADIWSMGCVLYYMLILKSPFSMERKSELSVAIETKRWQYCGIVDRSPKLDDSAKQFLSFIFKEQPEQRLTAAELLGNSWFKS